MAIKAAKNLTKRIHLQRGAVLIELMVSSMLGLVAIAIIGSVFLAGQKVASKRTLELLVLQNLTTTTQMMRAEIQRAGFNGGSGTSVTLLGESDTLVVSGASIGFAYYLPSDNKYQHVKYKMVDNRLMTCERKSTSVLSFSALTGCYNLFDQNTLAVASFSVSTIPLLTSAADSQFTKLYLEAELLDGRFNHSVHVGAKTRNWQ